jgi:predicted nuclease of predicted toxin-antitoxin system
VRFLVDENLPRSLAPALRAAGHYVDDVRDLGCRGSSDADIFECAQRARLTLLTRDVGFGNMARFPPGPHSGIVLIRLPNSMSALTVTERVLRALTGVSDDELTGGLIVVGSTRVRVRRTH